MNLPQRSRIAALAAASCLGLCAARPARAVDAAILNSVPADRNVVTVIDVQRVLATQPIRALDQAGYLAELDNGLDQLEQWTGFRLRRDLHHVITAKYENDEKNQLAFLEGQFDQNQILTALRLNPQYAQTDHAGTAVHAWFDDKEGRLKYGAFLGPNLLVIGPQDGVEAVIDTRASTGNSFGDLAEVRRALANATTDPLLWVVARDVGKTGGKLTDLYLTLDVQSAVELRAAGEAADAQAAQTIRDLLNGLIALGRLAPGKPEAQLLAEGATVQQSGNSVALTISVPEDKFTTWLLTAAKAKHGKS